MVGCTAKQGSHCGHTLEKCPNCNGNHIAFSIRCAKKPEAARAVQQSRKTGLARQGSMRRVTGANSAALGARQKRGIRDNKQEPMADEMADVTTEKKVAQGERYLLMAETTWEIEIQMGAAASNDYHSPAQLRQVLCLDHGNTGDGSGTKSRFENVAGATGGKRQNWNQPFRIRD